MERICMNQLDLLKNYNFKREFEIRHDDGERHLIVQKIPRTLNQY